MWRMTRKITEQILNIKDNDARVKTVVFPLALGNFNDMVWSKYHTDTLP